MMEAFALYLLKVSGVLFIFWTIYRLFLYRETTFTSNRFLLLFGLPMSLLLPLIKIKQTIFVDVIPTGNAAEINQLPVLENTSTTLISWPYLLLVIYISGCLFFLIRFVIQLHTIESLTKTGRTWREDEFVHIETQKPIAPFSFFKSLFYNPDQFEKIQLEAILTHEKVHAKEWHSIDVIIAELVKIVLWFNPMVWVYERSIKQNLEFLADAKTVNQVNKTSYQYLMVEQATGQQIAITNSFYNSLIKKRIVMLNKNQSKRISALKSLLVVPLLALFLYGFGIEKEYEFKNFKTDKQLQTLTKFEFSITKNTTEKELTQMKQDMAEDGIDFSYTTVRNDDRDIIDISLEVVGKGENGATFKNAHNTSDSVNGISPVVILIDLEHNLVSIGSKGAYKPKVVKVKKGDGTVWISSDNDESINVWSGLDELGEHEDIIIKKENGARKIFINGDEVEEDELQMQNVKVFIDEDTDADKNFSFHISTDEDGQDGEKVKIKKSKSKKGKNVFIIKDTDVDGDIEVLEDDGFIFIDGSGATPLYVVDGREVSKKAVEKLSPKKIATMNVIKGDAAYAKYGPKAKNGVIEITTKAKK